MNDSQFDQKPSDEESLGASQWERAKAIFLCCLSSPESEHASILRAECGDDLELDKEVRQLLDGHHLDSSVPTLGLGDRSESGSSPDGSDLADLAALHEYRVIEKIGAGGFGDVYLAEQSEPRRRVALKLIRTGLSREEYRIRFEAERQALAVMSHPNVAQVFDAGTTRDTDRPYFVMEYVEGFSLIQHCDHHRMKTQDRIELFIQVCEGVQHAHTKGIIHRDLKPANVLVANDSDRATPKIIDFGVAKTFGQPLTAETLHTEYGRIIGTLEYMSPEQAELGEDVDTRTDVYSLGVILYELLVGENPLEVRRLRSSGYVALRKAILEDEPTPPSDRISGLENDRPLEDRNTDLRALERDLKGDLDWIVLRALEKDRVRRYESAAEFARDLRRHLAGEPVHARPPSVRYRMGKFVRRNPAAVVAGIAVVLSLIAAVVVLGWANLEIGRERDAARTARDSARSMASELLGLSDTKRLDDAKKAASDLNIVSLEARPALRDWLDVHGVPLAERLSEHERVLAELRRRAEPWADVEQSLDRESHPRAEPFRLATAQLEKLAKELSDLESSEGETDKPSGGEERMKQTIADESAWLEARIATLESEITGRRTYRFLNEDGEADGDSQWEHDTRAELVHELRAFIDDDHLGNGLGSVRWRLAEIDRLETATLTGSEARDRWERCRNDLAADDAIYGRLDLKPQFGLLPLDRNPKTGLWEFVHLASGEEPVANTDWKPSEPSSLNDPALREEPAAVRGRVNRWTLSNATGLVLVLLPPIRAQVGAELPALGVTFDADTLTIRSIQPESIAERLGLAIDDQVLEVNQTQVDSATALRKVLSPLVTGDRVTVAVKRGEAREEFSELLPPSNYDPRAQVNEFPVTRVDLDPYFLSKYELTQAQWHRLTGKNPSYINSIDYPRYASRLHPVEQINWLETNDVLSRLGLCLPTEVQWESACRAGSSEPFSYGQEIHPYQANIAGESYRRIYDQPRYGEKDWDDGFGAHAPIGSFVPNRFGLHDIHGNVWEWCQDNWGTYASVARPGDGLRLQPAERGRVFRGGAFRDPAFIVRAACRNQQLAEFRFNTIGVRPAARVQP